ncbi:uncharacterized protein HMPREF1541_10520 [Cyphellophora europaea CBS 101466]|uniref:Uncharacterized protein n=1 Tax=Cyphellophora europaea (strain CBS 101466) TaxID=1220924 RepID=W2S6S6_CYPE1|nr:uncharacterized protein HMPREF1541_10520 [Cyphellophora europaea CBS 101466]ETN44340.1 hypothetical protein HMPREF1541_10520 [Cyphellophora europaea CBS 101466]
MAALLLHPATRPFLLHILIEVPATLTFLLLPSRQLGQHTPHAHAIVRQYALSLLASVLVAATFAFRDTAEGEGASDQLRGKIAGALAVYHVGPVVRAAARVARQARRGERLVLSEAGLYLVVHGLAGWELGRACWEGWLGA